MFKLQFFIGFILAICFVNVQEVNAKSLFQSERLDTTIYHLQPDTTVGPFNSRYALLPGNDFRKKSSFLNDLRVNLKHAEIESSGWQLDSIVFTAWSEELQEIVKSRRQAFLANEPENIMQLRNYNWDSEKDHWIIDEAQYYFLNETGQLDSLEIQKRVTLNYILYTKKIYSYQEGLLHDEITKEKFDEFEDWKLLLRHGYEYDSLKQLTRVYTQEWDKFSGNHWSTYEYVKYDYDLSGNLILETGYDYDDYEMIATKKYAIEYSFNEFNKLTTAIEYVKGWQEGMFVAGRKQENTYDSGSRLIGEIYYNWDYDMDNWLEESRKWIEYTGSTTLLQSIKTQEWTGEWTDKLLADYLSEMDISVNGLANYAFVTSFLPVFEIDGLVCDRIDHFESINSSWQSRGAATYYFSQGWPVGVSTSYRTTVKVFPNPVIDRLQITADSRQKIDCTLFDLNGRILFRKTFTGNTNINLQSLVQGVYLLELKENGSRILNEKIIKK